MVAQRVRTALVLAAALLLVLFVLPPTVSGSLLALLVSVGAWEWSRLAGLERTGSRVAYLAGGILVGVAAVYLASRGWLAVLPWVDVAVWIVGLAWMLRFPVPIPSGFSAITGLLVLPLGWLFLIILLSRWGSDWALFLFVLIAAADSGAFFSGRAFGRRKLAPKVSPGKTWEGVAGGLGCAALVGLGGAVWFDLPALPAVLIGTAVAGFSVLGDLTVSMPKRDIGLKDSGSIFPGHGGVLDRIDSLLAAIPLFLVGFGWVAGL